MVQSPETARHPSMPRSAIATGLTDFVLPITKMPTALMQYVEHANLTASTIETENNRQELHEILTLLRLRAGFDFRCYKKGMPSRRIRRDGLRLKLRGILHKAVQENQPAEALAKVNGAAGPSPTKVTVTPLHPPTRS